MKKRYLTLLAALFLMATILSQASAGDYYKWTDEQGNTHFADSPSAIPPKYRNNVDEEDYGPAPSGSTVSSMSEGADYSFIDEARRQEVKTPWTPPPSSGAVQQYTDWNFNSQVIMSDKVTLVEFWAIWCGPCRRIAPHIDRLAAEYDGKVNIGKLDIDHNKRISKRYGVKSIPAILIFKDGQLVTRSVGYKSIERLRRMVKSAI